MNFNLQWLYHFSLVLKSNIRAKFGLRLMFTFLYVEMLQFLVVTVLLSRLDGQSGSLLINLPKQKVLQAHGEQIPARDKNTAHEMRTECHYLAHKHWSQNVGQLVDYSDSGIHIYQNTNIKVSLVKC